jgi:hypothetical protein
LKQCHHSRQAQRHGAIRRDGYYVLQNLALSILLIGACSVSESIVLGSFMRLVSVNNVSASLLQSQKRIHPSDEH